MWLMDQPTETDPLMAFLKENESIIWQETKMNLSLRTQNNVTDGTQDSLYLFDLHVQQSTTNLVGSLVAASLSDFTGKH